MKTLMNRPDDVADLLTSTQIKHISQQSITNKIQNEAHAEPRNIRFGTINQSTNQLR